MKKQYLYFFSAFILLAGCSDFLEQQPGTQIAISEQLADAKGIKTALNGLYRELRNTCSNIPFITYGDLQAGNLAFTPRDTSATRPVLVPDLVTQIYGFEDTALESDMASTYSGFYTVINNANLILENIEFPADLNSEEASEIEAQCYAARAFSHLMLARMYAQDYSYADQNFPGIVYKTQSIQEELAYDARLSLVESYNRVQEDFNSALDRFTGATVLEGPSYSFFTAESTRALLSRTLLEKQDFTGALNHAEQVMSTAGNLTPKEMYVEGWKEPIVPLSETLFEITPPRNDADEVSGGIGQIYGVPTAVDWSDYAASRDLLAIYSDTDIRRELFLEKEIPTLENGIQIEKAYFFIDKYQGEPGIPIIRLSEVYLIAAEAALKFNQPDLALEYLNTIRLRSGLNALSNTENLLDEILLERRRELAFENSYFYDLKRNQRDLVRGEDCISTTCNLTYPSTFYVLPIPQQNINLNENLIQNEGY